MCVGPRRVGEHCVTVLRCAGAVPADGDAPAGGEHRSAAPAAETRVPVGTRPRTVARSADGIRPACPRAASICRGAQIVAWQHTRPSGCRRPGGAQYPGATLGVELVPGRPLPGGRTPRQTRRLPVQAWCGIDYRSGARTNSPYGLCRHQTPKPLVVTVPGADVTRRRCGLSNGAAMVPSPKRN